jgi:hypothetical protein
MNFLSNEMSTWHNLMVDWESPMTNSSFNNFPVAAIATPQR